MEKLSIDLQQITENLMKIADLQIIDYKLIDYCPVLSASSNIQQRVK